MKIKFAPQDMWIGLYVKRQETVSRTAHFGGGLVTGRVIIRTWYLCLLPCLPIIWQTQQLENV